MRIFSGLRVILFGVLCAAATLVARAGETVYHSDVVVLGSGAAGLSAAVAAAAAFRARRARAFTCRSCCVRSLRRRS